MRLARRAKTHFKLLNRSRVVAAFIQSWIKCWNTFLRVNNGKCSPHILNALIDREMHRSGGKIESDGGILEIQINKRSNKLFPLHYFFHFRSYLTIFSPFTKLCMARSSKVPIKHNSINFRK